MITHCYQWLPTVCIHGCQWLPMSIHGHPCVSVAIHGELTQSRRQVVVFHQGLVLAGAHLDIRQDLEVRLAPILPFLAEANDAKSDDELHR